jgi:hypothetical protein
LIVDVTYGAITTGDSFTTVRGASEATADANGTPTVVTGGGVLHVVAHDGTGDKLYVQVIKGTMAANNDILYYAGTNLSTGDATKYVQVDTGTLAITERTISTPYIGVSTGTAIIGGYGVGIDNNKLSSSDKVFDLTNTQYSPPTTVTNTVSGLESTEDYLFVAPWDGTTTDANDDPAVDTDQMTINATYNTAGITTISVNDIPGSTPDSGTIRIVNDEGFHVLAFYSSYDDGTDDFTLRGTDTFVDGDVTVGTDNIASTSHGFVNQMVVQLTTTGTLPTGLSTGTDYYIIRVDDDNYKLANSLANCAAGTAVDITAAAGGGTHTVTPNYTDFSGSGLRDSATSGNHCYVTYLDKLADAASLNFQAVHDTDLDLVVVVRDGGASPIKQFISEWSFTSSNASISAIRTTDT